MEIIKIGKKEVKLDENLLRFNETTLNDFYKTFGGIYNEYVQAAADATYLASCMEDIYDQTYSAKFQIFKYDGNTDKMSECKARTDADVKEALENMRIAKRNSMAITNFVRSLDKTYESSKELSYNLRKELDKLYPYLKETV